jgi:hypothetical protein
MARPYPLLLLLATFMNAQKLSCPTLSCAEVSKRGVLDPDLCYERDLEQPSKVLLAYTCD